MEEYAYVLDFSPYGIPGVYEGVAVAQLIGEKYFTLLEATVKEGVTLVPGQRVFVGKDGRKEIEKIKRRINYSQLTSAAKENLPEVVRKIVEAREKEFISFINRAGPISIRVHQLDLIPGIGKKNMHLILEEREKKPFESFADLKARVPTWLDPVGSFVERIIRELKGEEKHYFFVKPFLPKRGRF